MQANTRPSFTFLVVTYNHQDYILEHLESIKYLVLSYGAGIDVDVIINDDCSRDNTCTLVDKWLQLNAALFRSVKTIYNPSNLGTCASVNNMLKHMVADNCKLTAGDDVYSFENIFDLTQHDLDVAMTSGRALYLTDDVLSVDRLSNILATATQVIYQNDSLLHRFKHFSYNNAPNLFYATECLLHPKVRAYLERFDVMEDWPLQVAIARQFPERSFKLIDQVLVYYRRTAGSTYIVANQRFVKDKIQMYDSLILNERNSIERLRLNSRKFCFKTQNRWINKIFNLDLYYFAASCIFQLYRIFKKTKTANMRLNHHQLHYARIKAAVQINNMMINHQQHVEKL
jgi:glycosyltransferase involved in cell wall biosynthesis